ncbi:hypothetical protein ACPOL_7185 (plasmid) [Acidisarcina polymorpha]|uniref:Uncharacterized protein n=1 Tax=Acidisarcina polymorpha TaxID=2211140 RepID=A0A2Z5GCM5_9BACT|nr:hypothetical protein [Acidisarcina polymorpha]AXC16375.1 hypothetical protein ACPOL_7185 [Acidisarcina polymorpha]
MDFGDPVLDGRALDFVFDVAITQRPFEGDGLALLESLREVGEIAPGIDAEPFGAGFVVSFLVLPALT